MGVWLKINFFLFSKRTPILQNFCTKKDRHMDGL